MITHIEHYQGKYTDQIIELIIGIQTQEFGIPISLDDQPDLLNIKEFYQRGVGNFWLARQDQRVIGTIALIDIGHGQCALRKMFVAKDFRGKERGVAKSLLEALLLWAKEHQTSEILLGTTAKYFAAHRFYEKNGFQEISKINLPSNFPVMSVDSKFFKLVLAD